MCEASTVSETELPLYQGHAEANLSIQSPFQNARMRNKLGQAAWLPV